MKQLLPASLAIFCLGSIPLCAQRDEVLASDRPETWAMRYFAGAALMQGNGPAQPLAAGKWGFGFEVANLPHLSAEKRTVGFNGTKEEDLNKSPLLARPLAHYGLTDRISLTASYLPPIEVFDGLRTHLLGVALNLTAFELENGRLTARAITQWSRAEGDFTVPAEVAGDPDFARNPFQAAAPSEDVFTSLTSSLELSFDYALPTTARPVWLFASAALTYADLDFEVDYVQFDGFRDNRHLMNNGLMTSLAVGARWGWTPRLTVLAGAFYVPLAVRRPPARERALDPLLHFRLLFEIRL